MKTRFPRRKVASSFKGTPTWANYFSCTLTCGHKQVAYGIRPRGSSTPIAPKTCECRKCPPTTGVRP